jgi:hypothetical protein
LTEPPSAAYQALHIREDEFTSLLGTHDRLVGSGVELVEMVLADQDCWDRYVAAQWWTLSDWLRTNPNSPEAPGVGAFLEASRRSHLAYARQYLGWGVFVGLNRSGFPEHRADGNQAATLAAKAARTAAGVWWPWRSMSHSRL